MNFSCFVALVAVAVAVSPAFAASLTVTVQSSPDAWPGRGDYLTPGGSVTLRATEATTDGRGPIEATGKLQWYYNRIALDGQTRAQLKLSGLTSNHTGNYFLRSTTDQGVSESNWVTLNIFSPPAPTAVDRDFRGTAPRASYTGSDSSYTAFYTLRDNSSVVGYSFWAGHGVNYSYERVLADGSRDPNVPNPLWYRPYYELSAPAIASVLDDGTVFMALPPYRWRAVGMPITTFSTPVGINPAVPVKNALLQGDGKIIITQEATVLRVFADGSPDPSFALDRAHFSPLSVMRSDSRGRLLASGPVAAPGNGQMIVRLNSDGAFDPTFTPIPVPTLATTSVSTMEDDGLLIRDAADRYTRYHPDGTVREKWDLTGWIPDGSKSCISPAGDIYVAQNDLGIYRIRNGARPALDPDFIVPSDRFVRFYGLHTDYAGRLLALGTLGSWQGHVTSGIARFNLGEKTPVLPPLIALDPAPSQLQGGTTITLRARALGSGPLTYSWVSLNGGVLPSNSNSPTLVFPSFKEEHLGRYQLRVTGAGGTALSPVIELTASTLPRLANLSSRSLLGGKDDNLIVGLTLEVPPAYTNLLLLRGAGPALTQFGVTSPLPNPSLTFMGSGGSVLRRNDDWVDDSYTRNYVGRAAAFPFTTGSRDALILHETPGGSYTLQLRDTEDRSGVGLIECYNVGGGTFTNLSLRGKAGADDSSLIAGFAIEDPQALGRTLRLLVRALGSSLAQFGVPSPLPNPTLTLYNSAGARVAVNDDWSAGPNAPEIDRTTKGVGAFDLPPSSKDAAIVVDLPAGAYTAIVTDASGATGTALIELYRVK